MWGVFGGMSLLEPIGSLMLAKLTVTNLIGPYVRRFAQSPPSPASLLQTLSTGSLPDGNVRKIRRIYEMFHLVQQVS